MADLPDEFDLIVIGTGFTESCIAAAASRIGKSVLHVDPNLHYGGTWASFGLAALSEYLLTPNQEIRNGSCKWHVDESGEQFCDESIAAMPSTSSEDKPIWTKTKLLQQTRRFNLDLCPRIVYSAGELVQLLISSNICRYAEFRAVDRVCTRFNGQIISMPCSRSDVFNTKELNIVEKRLLMKFLTMCLTFGEDKTEEDMIQFRGKTFREYLDEQKVTNKITTCVMQAIAMCNDETSFEVGMQNTKRFLRSLGRYGNSPFIFPMYGCGEIPQCFCRLCAVFGGIYCLHRDIGQVTINADTNWATVMIGGKPLRARHVVTSHGNAPENLEQSGLIVYGMGSLVNSLSRAILIASTPLGSEELNTGGGGVNVMRLVDGDREAILIQLSHFSGVCPKGVYVFHLTTPALSDNPESDLQPFHSQVFNGESNSPRPLYSAYFTLTKRQELASSQLIDASTPVFCTAGPCYEVDYDLSIQNARDVFSKIYGDVEFLPRAPDPEEIIFDGEDPQALNEGNLPEDLRQQLRELETAAQSMELGDEATHDEVTAAGSPQSMDAN